MITELIPIELQSFGSRGSNNKQASQSQKASNLHVQYVLPGGCMLSQVMHICNSFPVFKLFFFLFFFFFLIVVITVIIFQVALLLRPASGDIPHKDPSLVLQLRDTLHI